MFAMAWRIIPTILYLLPAAVMTAVLPMWQPTPLIGPNVTLPYATYVGRPRGNGVNEFLGMRYAAAPLGDLRWRAPIEPPKEEIVRPATRFKPICLGNETPAPRAVGQDEDCLFVNVWTPANATVESKLPVWVFIQGGGYVYDSQADYDGVQVVSQSGHNIVFVNFNYRVGLFGFLASEKVRQNGDLNAGLLDQRRLLLWVKQNIAQFGGDPDHVVIHGASAGAGSVAIHLAAYGGNPPENLFVGAISESLFFPAQPFVQEVEWQFDLVAGLLGCNATGVDQMACLRSQPMLFLQAINVAAPFPGRLDNPLFFWTPCVDGSLIQDLPYSLYEAEEFLSLPVMFGTCTDEGSVFVSPLTATQVQFTNFFQDNFPNLTSTDVANILGHYPQIAPALTVPVTGPWYPTLSKAYGDSTFICPTINLLRHITARSAAGAGPSDYSSNNIFAYRYNVQAPENTISGLGVPHVFDAAAIFGPSSLPGPSLSYFSTGPGGNAPIVPILMDYYISFIRTLDPNVYAAPGAPVWDPWHGGMRLKIETGNTTMEPVMTQDLVRCAFWETLATQMRQ